MSSNVNPNAGAVLTLDVETGPAELKLSALERRLENIGASGSPKQADAIARLAKELEVARASSATLEKQVEVLSQKLSGLGSAGDSAGRGFSRMSNRMSIQLRSAEMTGRLSIQKMLEERRRGLQQLAAMDIDEARTRQRGLQQIAAAKEDETRERSRGTLQYRAILENEARDRRLGLQQLAAAREDELRVEREALDRQSKIRADALFQRASQLEQAKRAERAAIALEAGLARDRVERTYGSLATAAASTGSAAIGAQIQTLQGQRAVLDPLTESMRRAARETGQFTAAQWEAHAAARGLAGSLGALWVTYGSLIPLLGGAALGTALKSMITQGAAVEYQLEMISAVGEGARVSMSELADATRGSVFSFSEATDALRVLVQAGMSSTDALQTLPQVLKLSTIGEVELGQGALTVAAMLETFNLAAGEASRVTNTMAAAAAASPTSVAAMMEAMKQASSVSTQYSVTIEETSAALAMLAKRGIEGSAAGTAFRNLVKELAAPATQRAAKSIEDMGLSMFDAQGNIKPLVENLQQIADVAQLMTQEDRIKWFESFTNERAAKALDAIVGDMEGFKKTIEEVAAAQQGLGFVTEANAQLMTTLSGQWSQLGADLGRVFADVYQDAQGTLLNLVVQLREAVGSEAFKSSLRGLAESFASLTLFVVENADSIAKLLAVLAGSTIVTIFASSLVTLGKALTSLATVTGIASAFTAAKAAFIAANAGASGLAATLGGLGILLRGPVFAGIAAVVSGAGLIAYAMSSSSEASTDATKAAQALADKTNLLADSAERGVREIDAETESLKRHIEELRNAKSATDDLTKSKKWASLEEAKTARDTQLAQIESKEREYRQKYGKGWNENIGPLAMISKQGADQSEIQSLYKSYGEVTNNVQRMEKSLADALAAAPVREATARLASSVEEIRNLNKKREDTIRAGQQAELALSAGAADSEGLKARIEAGKKAAALTPVDASAFDPGNPQSLKSLEDLRFGLAGATIKPPVAPNAAADRAAAAVADRLARDSAASARTIAQEQLKQMESSSDLVQKSLELYYEQRLITEGQFNEALYRLGEARAEQASIAAKKEIEVISQHLQNPKLTKVGRQTLTNDMLEAQERLRTAQADASAKTDAMAIDRQIKQARTVNEHKDALTKLNEQQRLNLASELESFQLSREADPIKLAGLQAQLEATREYSRLIAGLNTEIASAVDNNDLQNNLRDQLDQVIVSMAEAQAAAKAQAEGLAAAQMSPLYGVQTAMQEIRYQAQDLATVFRDGLSGSLDIAAQGFVDLASTGKMSVREMVADMLTHLSKLLAHQAFMMVANWGLSMIPGLGGTSMGLGSGLSSGSTSLSLMGGGQGLRFANGGAFAGRGVEAFAKGGAFGSGTILTQPTFFRFAQGGRFANGVAGEAGPEAALPLKRMANGKLGVYTEGGSGGVHISQQFNVTVQGGGSEGGQAQGEAAAKALRQEMKSAVMEVLIDQKRPGGVLS
jgi:TP901 family phage tail tape measure protein/lambda family phage tail tape measure protein